MDPTPLTPPRPRHRQIHHGPEPSKPSRPQQDQMIPDNADAVGAFLNPNIYPIICLSKYGTINSINMKIGALFVNAQEGNVIWTTLIKIFHPQPPTLTHSDNSTATGIVNSTIRQQLSKAIDMRFYWVRNQVKQGNFMVYLTPLNVLLIFILAGCFNLLSAEKYFNINIINPSLSFAVV